jgi:hypothetical protein
MNPKPAPMFAFSRPSCKTDAGVLTATSTSGNLIAGVLIALLIAVGSFFLLVSQQ